MAKPRDDRPQDLLRPALEAIIDLGHPLHPWAMVYLLQKYFGRDGREEARNF